MAGVLGMMAWSSLGMMMMMPNVTVVDASNQPVEASPAADDGPARDDAPAEAGGVDDGGGFGDVDW